MDREPENLPPIKLKATGDGIELIDSILSLDALYSGKLSFISSALTKAKLLTLQAMATEETIKLIELEQKKKPAALVYQYNRPFSIGKLRIELLPSGSILGGASAHIEVDGNRLLYAPQVQIHKIPTVRQIQLKRSQVLVLSAQTADPQEKRPSRKKELGRLISYVSKLTSENKWPVIHTDAVGSAQEIIKHLTVANIPVAVDKTISKVNKIYEAYGFDLGNVTLHYARKSRPRVLVTSQNKNINPSNPHILVNAGYNAPKEFPGLSATFNLNLFSSGSDFKEVITAVCPEKIYFFGAFAKQYAEHFSAMAEEVIPLYPNSQPTLF